MISVWRIMIFISIVSFFVSYYFSSLYFTIFSCACMIVFQITLASERIIEKLEELKGNK